MEQLRQNQSNKVTQNLEFISVISGDGSKKYKPITLLSHLSSLRHLLALMQVLDKKCLLIHCNALYQHQNSRLNNYQALKKSHNNDMNDNSDSRINQEKTKLSLNQFKNLVQKNGNVEESRERQRYRKMAQNIQQFVDSLQTSNKFGFILSKDASTDVDMGSCTNNVNNINNNSVVLGDLTDNISLSAVAVGKWYN